MIIVTLLLTLSFPSAPLVVQRRGEITGLQAFGTPGAILRTATGASVKFMDPKGNVFTLGPQSALMAEAASRYVLLKGELTMALLTGSRLTLRDGKKLLRFGPGYHRVTHRVRAPYALSVGMEAPKKPTSKASGKGAKAAQPEQKSPPPVQRFRDDLCLLEGSADLKKRLCTQKGQCHDKVLKGRCFSGQAAFDTEDEDEDETKAPVFLPSFTAELDPIDFLLLLPALQKEKGGQGPKKQSGSDTASAGGGSMCLNSAGSGASASDVGQNTQTTTTVIPTTQLLLRITFSNTKR